MCLVSKILFVALYILSRFFGLTELTNDVITTVTPITYYSIKITIKIYHLVNRLQS